MRALRSLWLLAATLSLDTQLALAQEKLQCKFALVAQLPLNYSGPELNISSTGTINGTAAAMQVHTGIDDVYLTRTGIDRHGLRMTWDGYRRTTGTVKEITLGPIRTGRRDLEVMPNQAFAPSEDIIIGGSFLFQTDVEIALPDKRINFFKASGCGDEFLGYWKEGAIELPIQYDKRYLPNPTFEVELNGQKMTAEINSGAPISLVNIAAAKRAGFRPDAPGVAGGGYIYIGKDRLEKWKATFDTFSLGEETIDHVRLSVADMKTVKADIILGADFLRTHRVLFAMSQRKLYVSYVGGDVFPQSNQVDGWVRQEANAGNRDAEYALSLSYQRRGSKDEAQQWLDRATAHGQPHANLLTGQRLLREGKFADAATHLKLSLDQLPAERYGALSLYLARLQLGQADEAKRELSATFERDGTNQWPRAIANFYLGRINAEALLDQTPKWDICTAYKYMGELYSAQGNAALAEAARSSHSAKCVPAAQPAGGA